MLTHSSNTVVKFHLISRFFRFLAPFVLETYTSLRLATPRFARISQDSFALYKFQALMGLKNEKTARTMEFYRLVRATG